jgi:ribosome biogenesis GTPase / thiamine phosphate phosphatase
MKNAPKPSVEPTHNGKPLWAAPLEHSAQVEGMELKDLGFDRWFEQHAEDLRRPGHHLARVTAVDRGACLVRNERREIPAELAGKFRFSARATVDLPCVGDWVSVQYHNRGNAALIHDVFPRKTFLRRKCAGQAVESQPERCS